MRWKGRWDEDIESANLAPQSDVAVETPLVATSPDDLIKFDVYRSSLACKVLLLCLWAVG